MQQTSTLARVDLKAKLYLSKRFFKCFYSKVFFYFLKNTFFQNLNYKLIFVEQLGNGPFNKGSLLNIGFIEAIKMELKIINKYSESGNCTF